MLCASIGYRCALFAPDSISQEKIDTMRSYGAELVLCDAKAKYDDDSHYFQRARSFTAAGADAGELRFFVNQFENTANADAHCTGTAPELWRQVGGRLDAFACAAGTGGTIGGFSQFFAARQQQREESPAPPDPVLVVLVDPPGSSLCSYVVSGSLSASEGSTVAEGIGIGRLTANFATAKVSAVTSCADRELVEMAHWLMKHEGLCVGPSAALNVVGAVKAAWHLAAQRGSAGGGDNVNDNENDRVRVATVVCDGGERYKSKLWNREWLAEKGLLPQSTAGRAGPIDFVSRDPAEVQAV
jgi:cysteine synthase A